MIESPILEEAYVLMRVLTLRSVVIDALTARFGEIPTDRLVSLDAVSDEAQLKALHRLAVTCPTLEAFLTGLNGPGSR
jgi:hypothetical protein